jgi:hypothetical protein
VRGRTSRKGGEFIFLVPRRKDILLFLVTADRLEHREAVRKHDLRLLNAGHGMVWRPYSSINHAKEHGKAFMCIRSQDTRLVRGQLREVNGANAQELGVL